MSATWAHVAPSFIAAFLASLVEFVEALTIVLAVGAVRGWRGAIAGSGLGLAVLLALVVVLGPTLTRIPLTIVQVAVGTMLLLFGMRWLRKSILRAAGVIALHDEITAFAEEKGTLMVLGAAQRKWDRIAIATTFKITMLEGTEVVFIVVAIGAGGQGLLASASVGALAALLIVLLLGVLLHRPVASVPENSLKFTVGVLLCAFGTFWAGEGMGVAWPGNDWWILALIVGYAVVALLTTLICRFRFASTAASV